MKIAEIKSLIVATDLIYKWHYNEGEKALPELALSYEGFVNEREPEDRLVTRAILCCGFLLIGKTTLSWACPSTEDVWHMMANEDVSARPFAAWSEILGKWIEFDTSNVVVCDDD